MRQIRRPSGRLIHVCIWDRGFWHFPVKSGIAARTGGGLRRMMVPARFSRRRRLSSAVEQRFCKPKVGGSIPSAGTTDLADTAA
jgi:hypothetical protein